MTGQPAPVRVRVKLRRKDKLSSWWCPSCREVGAEWGYLKASRAAHRHAATCPALRLALLLRELKALRDKLNTYADRNLQAAQRHRGDHDYRSYFGGLCNANRGAAADLTALTDRATDGGTG